MSYEVAITGWSFRSAYAPDFNELIKGLSTQRCIAGERWFTDQQTQQSVGVLVNPLCAPDKVMMETPTELRIERAVDHALRQAGLSCQQLEGERVRVYLAGTGLRADYQHFYMLQQRNDAHTLELFPEIKHLHSGTISQDKLASSLAGKWHLKWPPISVFCASNSSLGTLKIAHAAISYGECDLALIIGWADLVLQDMLLLDGQRLLSASVSQPFGDSNDSVMPAAGTAVLVLENIQQVRQRTAKPVTVLRSVMSYQSSGELRQNAFAVDFRGIANVISKTLLSAGMEPEDIGCVMPHGNGMRAGDKAEAMALNKIWGDHGVPVVSYKGQIGYFSTCSTLTDIMIACDALLHKRLLAFTSHKDLDKSHGLNLHADAPPLPLNRRAIVNLGLGIDGSAMAAITELAGEVDCA